METINDRMELIVNEQFNGNKSAFAKAIGIQPAFMSSYLGNARRSKPSIDVVQKIITKLDIDPYWLITGQHNPTVTSIKGNGVKFNGSGNNNNNTTTNNYHYGSKSSKDCTGSELDNMTLASNEVIRSREELLTLRQKVTSFEKFTADKDKTIDAQQTAIDLLKKRVEELEERLTQKGESGNDK